MTDLGFTPNESQKALLERIQRGERIIYVTPRSYGKSLFYKAVAKMLKNKKGGSNASFIDGTK